MEATPWLVSLSLLLRGGRFARKTAARGQSVLDSSLGDIDASPRQFDIQLGSTHFEVEQVDGVDESGCNQLLTGFTLLGDQSPLALGGSTGRNRLRKGGG